MRAEIKARRRSLAPEEKARLDRQVCENVLRLYQYRRAETVLVYMSTAIEVDTAPIIDHALAHGKRVALPRCIPGSRLMRFYFIRSYADLEKGSFGLLEPKTDCEALSGSDAGVCLVPALAYDRCGYRLGYGGGYYDRFLSEYRGQKVGVIYSADLRRGLPRGRFDRPVDLIASDSGFFYTSARPGKGKAPRVKNSPAGSPHTGSASPRGRGKRHRP